MGSVYWRHVRNVSRPRVGILSNGEEASKGTEITRAAASMLGQMATYVHYVGYVEGRDINRAKVDIVVTDGFNGNVALKTMEGFASFMLGNLREMFGASTRTRLAYLLMRKNLNAMRERLDPSEYGGAPLLGVSGVSIIAHGSSNPRAIRNAIRAAANEQLVHRVNPEILEILGKIQPDVPIKPQGKGFRALFSKMRERLHRRDREAEAIREAQPGADAHQAVGNREPAPEQGTEHSADELKIEHAKYESTHSSSHSDTGASPQNGVATGDKKHTSGELRTADESKEGDDSPDRPKDHS
jgi:hypothetical protein